MLIYKTLVFLLLSGYSIVCSYSQCFKINGVLVNACADAEGGNELLVFTVGPQAQSVQDLKVTLALSGDWCAAQCGLRTWTDGSAYMNSHLSSDCPQAAWTALDPNTGIIAPNSRVVLFTSGAPDYDFDVSLLCGYGPWYALFIHNTNPTGQFANGGNFSRSIVIQNIQQPQCKDSVAYIPDGFSPDNENGNFVRFDTGGQPIYLDLGSQCVLQPDHLLPLGFKLLAFEARSKEYGDTELNWELETDEALQLELQHSTDGKHFVTLAGPHEVSHFSHFLDAEPSGSYYRLKWRDAQGRVSYSKVIGVENNSVDKIPTIAYYTGKLMLMEYELNEKYYLNLLTLTGQMILDAPVTGEYIPIELKPGVYIALLSTTTDVYGLKLAISE